MWLQLPEEAIDRAHRVGKRYEVEEEAEDVQQYGRRLCLRVDDIPLRSIETPTDIEYVLHSEFEKMWLQLPEEATDKAHRVGKRYKVEDEYGMVTGITRQQVIVRFTNWTHRT